MKKIYSTTVIGQAEMLQVVLRNYGIESRLENEGGANYAVGMPSAAAPISIVVEDEKAEEAARIVAEEFTRPRTPEPTAVMIQMPCACGKTLEFPRGEEPPAVCPWCNRPTQAAPDPNAVPPSAPVSRTVVAVIVAAIALFVGLIVFGGFFGFRLAREEARRAAAGWSSSGESHEKLAQRLRAAVEAIPTAPMPAINPEAIVAEMAKGLPEEAARFSATLAPAAAVGDLVDRWLQLTAELSPDWAVDIGYAETRRPGRYSTRSQKGLVLLGALTLRKLRSMTSEARTFDGRLLERHLERELLHHVLFGTELSDPRVAFWGLLASHRHQDPPEILVARVEEIPAAIDDVRRELRNPTAPILDLALEELNETLKIIRDLEESSKDNRVPAAVAKARDALAEFGTHLRRLKDQAATPPPGDARFILFVVREGEFSTRTAREAAGKLLDEAERSLTTWNAQGASVQAVTAPTTKQEWRAEVERFVARARDLTVEKDFVDVPAGGLPEVLDSPQAPNGIPEEVAYNSRALQPRLQGRLWVAGWDTAKSPTWNCSATSGQINTMAETFPGRHVHALLSRRDGTLIRRLYGSSMLAEGWRAYCHRWAVGAVPNARYDAVYAEGVRYSQAWSAAVDICYLAGTLSEQEAVELIVGATSDTPELARMRLASALADPLVSAGAVLGELDLVALRDEMKAKMGPRFDLKQFHTKLLGFGRAPIALIREEMLRDAK